MEHLQGLSDMFTDSGFLYGVYKTVRHLAAAGVPVHQYLLTHRGQYSLTQLFAPGTVRKGRQGSAVQVGVCHADDLYYLWAPVCDMLPAPCDPAWGLQGQVSTLLRLLLHINTPVVGSRTQEIYTSTSIDICTGLVLRMPWSGM
jgi:hypothetical protein